MVLESADSGVLRAARRSHQSRRVHRRGGQAGGPVDASLRATGWADQAGLVTACRTWLMAERTWNASAISMMP